MTTATATADRKPLTKPQAAVFRFLVSYWGEHARMPTIEAICEGLGFASKNGAVCHLTALRRKGYVEWREAGEKGLSRNISVPELRAAARVAADRLLAELEGS